MTFSYSTPTPPAPTASGWSAPAPRPKEQAVGDGRAPDPGRPTPRQEAPRPAALVPPPQRAKQARKSAHCRVGDWSPRPHPPHPQPVGSAPRLHAPKDGRSGAGERPNPDGPRPGKRRHPLGALVPPQKRAKPARKSARSGVGDGFPRPHSPHRQPVGSGLWPHAPKDGRSGMGERPTPDASHTGKRRPPRRPHAALKAQKASSQQLALWGG